MALRMNCRRYFLILIDLGEGVGFGGVGVVFWAGSEAIGVIVFNYYYISI